MKNKHAKIVCRKNKYERKGWNPMKKYGAAICASVAMMLACITLFSGCTVIGLDSKALMSPPKEEGERGEIHSLLIDTAGEEVTFRYPRKGEYRSAIITKDFTGDHKEDAIALYESVDGSGGTTVSFLVSEENGWKILRSFTNTAVQVDRVCFADLDDDGCTEAVVGWGSSTMNSSSACVYDYTQGGILEIPMEQSYGEMAVTNLVDDVQDELCVVTLASDTSEAVAQLVRLSEGSLRIIEAAALDSSVLQYSQISAGFISPGTTGILLDGIRADNSMITQIIYWNEEKQTLEAPYSGASGKSQTLNITSRNAAAAYPSRDIDNDSIIEFPIVNVLPGNANASKDPAAYLINWNQFDVESKTPIRTMSTVINSNDGFWYLFPESWRDKITCRSDTATHCTTFYEWLPEEGNGTGAVGAAVLKIQVFTAEEWEAGSSGFTEIAERGGLIYAATIPEAGHELAPSVKEVQNSFYFLYTE